LPLLEGGAGYAGEDDVRRHPGAPVLQLIGLLLVVWIALMIIGAVLEGLFWLIVVGGLLFLGTAAYGWLKSNSKV
jgi:hypothetical protein